METRRGIVNAPGLSKEKAKELGMYGYPTQKRKKNKDSDKKDEERKKNKKALREIYK